MKKTAIFMLSLALVAGMLSGCSGDSSDSSAKLSFRFVVLTRGIRIPENLSAG